MKRISVAFLAFLTLQPLFSQPDSKYFTLPPHPIDPQLVQDQDEMTWDDYRPIPGKNWADPGLVPQRKFRMALVAVDFPDQPFVITLPKNSDLFGNPQTNLSGERMFLNFTQISG